MSNFCDFITSDNMHFICKNCEIEINMDKPQVSPPVLLCRNSKEYKLNFAQKIQNFAKAAVNHVANGLPMCTEEQIISRHNICLGCEYFQNDTCSKCGCPLIRNKQFVSKLAWADQECPIGKWGKITN